MNNLFMPEEVLHIRLPTKNEKIIFLDFDGVVHPNNNGRISSGYWVHIEPLVGHTIFLDEKIALVIRLCKELNARIVISSTWRYQDWGFEPYNKIFDNFVIGKTPEIFSKIRSRGNRQKEIEKYLENSNLKNEYVIIDDKEYNFLPNNKRLFLTDGDVGLTESITEQIINFF